MLTRFRLVGGRLCVRQRETTIPGTCVRRTGAGVGRGWRPTLSRHSKLLTHTFANWVVALEGLACRSSVAQRGAGRNLASRLRRQKPPGVKNDQPGLVNRARQQSKCVPKSYICSGCWRCLASPRRLSGARPRWSWRRWQSALVAAVCTREGIAPMDGPVLDARTKNGLLEEKLPPRVHY